MALRNLESPTWRVGIDAAGLPRKQKPNGECVQLCTPHGLRKRCCTDMAERGCTAHATMAVSGHLTLREIERFTKDGQPRA